MHQLASLCREMLATSSWFRQFHHFKGRCFILFGGINNQIELAPYSQSYFISNRMNKNILGSLYENSCQLKLVIIRLNDKRLPHCVFYSIIVEVCFYGVVTFRFLSQQTYFHDCQIPVSKCI